MILTCSGRLDASRAGYLNETLDRLVREGHYHLSLDLKDIGYISSAGIRSLVTQYKNLKAVNGTFYIREMSENVRLVLNMVGMAGMLARKPGETVKPVSPAEPPELLKTDGYIFSLRPLVSEGTTTLELYGNPGLLTRSAFSPGDARVVRAERLHFGIGLGALGDAFDTCKDRFGEFMITGRNAAYLPADGSKKPDYLSGTGQLVASLTELYGLHFTGNFSGLVRFDPAQSPDSIRLSQLSEILLRISRSDRLCLVMIAESGGLIGTALNTSPVEGKEIFSYPEIKETLLFTTEPAHLKMLTLTVGYLSAAGNGEAEKFVRPLFPGSTLKGHFHTSVFSYIPLKKTDINLEETLDDLFGHSELNGILHLTNDSREITGQGESRFIKGFCWLVPVTSIQLHG